ncbi:alanine--glyoxylate aminotransferase family protein [Acidisphaera sp. L21]|uniref:pyridoxal-phosphate-dependent aminotransferase family protein n=1 Tax=Acidisphaera sp. L21 TaxID=1641851 RepID=UPI0020B11E1F|nr:aminotransferase class V-fold PLP-dependent enzyme [Acidisphaera sp. L21]
MARKTGRQFFANPGPTNIPDSILRAMDRPTIDFMDGEFAELFNTAVGGLKRVLRTTGDVFIYTASGHGSWEATLVNLFSPGDLVLVVETGWFSEGWAAMAAKFGLRTKTVAAPDWRRGVEYAAITAALKETPEAKGVLCVHNETATGMMLDLPSVRAAIDSAGSDALLLVDTISSLGSLEFRFDDWGIDAAVGGSQKGLMLPTGCSFTAVSAKAMKVHASSTMARHYFDWSEMTKRSFRAFMGTIPTGMFYGLAESVRLIELEGLDGVITRHHRLAEGVRRAVRTWSGNVGGPELFCLSPDRLSDSVTAIKFPEGFNSDAVRKTALEKFNVSTGGGLGKLGGQVMRIGHLGDLNEPMILGTLGAVEMSLKINGVPHGRGGVDAAMEYLAEAA